MAELLVSVRSVADAAAALQGGAALIDVKEPAHGSLGRASDQTIAEVIQFIAGRKPVSAALGEFRDGSEPFVPPGLAFAKWGLAGCGAEPLWRRDLAAAADRLRHATPGCQLVAVAYADWRAAQAPDPAAVVNFVGEQGWEVLLIDTWQKNGKTLVDWLTGDEVAHLCRRCRDAGAAVALAGSLGPPEMARLRSAEPDWFAVRSAACREGRRDGVICPDRVRRLVRSLDGQRAACLHPKRGHNA
jgi:uncharacterized protein (UPF0264 family)